MRYFFLIAVCWWWSSLLSQPAFNAIPKLIAAHEQLIGVEEGLPDPCFQFVTLDKSGMMWLQPCRSSQTSYSVYMTKFDGVHAQSYSFAENKSVLRPSKSYFEIAGKSSDGFYFGNFWSDEQIYLMRFNPQLDSVAIIGLPGKYNKGEWIQEVFESNGETMVVTAEANLIRLYTYSTDNLAEQFSWELPNFPDASAKWGQFEFGGQTEEDWWFIRKLGTPFKVSKADGEVTLFESEDFPSNKDFPFKNNYYFLGERDGEIIIGNPFIETYKWSQTTGKFAKFDFFPEGLQDTVGIVYQCYFHEDSLGNLLYNINSEAGRFSLLLDTSGQWFDYSTVARYESIMGIYGKDFRQSVYLAQPNGIRSVQIRQPENYPIGINELSSCRGILQLDKDNFLVMVVNQTYKVDLGDTTSTLMTQFSPRNGFNNIMLDKAGHAWFTDKGQLFSLNIENGVKDSLSLAIEDGRLEWYDDDSSKLIIISTGYPLITVDLSTHEVEAVETTWQKSAGHQIHDTYRDSKGNIWIATGLGLYKFETGTKKIQVYTMEQGFPDFRMVHISERADGLLWIGTFDHGLAEFNPVSERVLRTINMDDGLSNNTVVGVLQDDEGYYWAATYNGLNMLSESGEVLGSFSTSNGLTNNEFNRLSHLKANDGKLLFGTIRGVNVIDPEKFRQAYFASKPLQIFPSAMMAYDSKGNIRQLNPSADGEKKPIILKPGDRDFELHFGLSEYLKTDKNRFQYRILGSENEEWRIAKNQSILVGNLSAGKYKIEVRGKDFIGRQTRELLVVPIIVRRAFYERAWFLALIGLLALSVIGSYILILRNRNRQLNLEVEKRNAQRQKDKKIIRQQSEALFSIDKPSATASGKTELKVGDFIRRIEEKNNGTDGENEQIGGLIQELLALSQKDKRSQVRQKQNILHLTRESFEGMRPQARLKDISYSLHCGISEELELDVDAQLYTKVIDSLLNNAIEMSPESGQVYASLTNSENWLFVKVRDSGVNIAAADIPNLFDRYFHLSNSSSLGVEGIGLALASEIARVMQGNIEVESIAGKGNIFHFRLPLQPANQHNQKTDP